VYLPNTEPHYNGTIKYLSMFYIIILSVYVSSSRDIIMLHVYYTGSHFNYLSHLKDIPFIVINFEIKNTKVT